MILQLICNEPLIFHNRICNIIIWIIVVGFQTKLCACLESLPNIISLGLILLQLFGHIVYPVFIHYAREEPENKTGTPHIEHPSTVDTNYNNGQFQNSRTVLPFPSKFKQPLNSGHLATPYNGQFLHSQLYTNSLRQPF